MAKKSKGKPRGVPQFAGSSEKAREAARKRWGAPDVAGAQVGIAGRPVSTEPEGGATGRGARRHPDAPCSPTSALARPGDPR